MPFPNNFRSLKAQLLKGLAYGPELLQWFRCYLLPPSQHIHSFVKTSRWFCLCLHSWVRRSWGQERRAEYITRSHSLGWRQGRGRVMPYRLTFASLYSPRTLVYGAVHVSLLVLGLLLSCFRRAPGTLGAGRSSEEERSQATETFSLSMQISSRLFLLYISQPPLF